MRDRVKISMAAAALLVIAGSVLARFDGGVNDWPAVALSELADAGSEVSSESIAGAPRVVNFWGSWCVACREEHPVLARLSAVEGVSLVGINHLDNRDDALRWLDYFGDPYEKILFDAEGRIGAALGIGALPVTLVVDGDGVIRYRHLGVLDNGTADAVIVPLVEELNRKR
jgi:cytochrome c biogenesis protein CcmG/thiol:disulfide interchange protein DsbE